MRGATSQWSSIALVFCEVFRQGELRPLLHIAEAQMTGTSRPSDLAKRLGIGRSATTTVLSRLVRLGLVRKGNDGSYAITPAGEAFITRAIDTTKNIVSACGSDEPIDLARAELKRHSRLFVLINKVARGKQLFLTEAIGLEDQGLGRRVGKGFELSEAGISLLRTGRRGVLPGGQVFRCPIVQKPTKASLRADA